MPKATREGGPLLAIDDCYIKIPGCDIIKFNNLPDISDQKSAEYEDAGAIGRSSPMKTYQHSANRTIGMQIHFIVSGPDDIENNLNHLRCIESAVYPREESGGAPFIPPPICQLKCGKLLADTDLCVVLKSYSVKFPTDVSWDANTFIPFKFDVDTSWDVVYRSSELPGQQNIIRSGTNG